MSKIWSNIYINWYWFSACECNEDGSHDITCDDDTGVCNCKDNVTNEKCDQCTSSFFGFPACEGKSIKIVNNEETYCNNWFLFI